AYGRRSSASCRVSLLSTPRKRRVRRHHPRPLALGRRTHARARRELAPNFGETNMKGRRLAVPVGMAVGLLAFCAGCGGDGSNGGAPAPDGGTGHPGNDGGGRTDSGGGGYDAQADAGSDGAQPGDDATTGDDGATGSDGAAGDDGATDGGV